MILDVRRGIHVAFGRPHSSTPHVHSPSPSPGWSLLSRSESWASSPFPRAGFTLALIGRAASTSYFREDPRGTSYQTVSGFYGPTLQYWPTERLFVGVGVGLAVLAADLYKDASKDVRFLATGFGLNARAGWAFLLPGTHHALTLSVDAFGSRFDKSKTLATAMNLGWQFF